MFGPYGLINSDPQKVYTKVAQFRQQCDIDGSVEGMNGTSLKYMVSYFLPKGLGIPERFTKLSVPALTWAIFPEPQCDLIKLWGPIYSECFPTSEYEQVEGPSFELGRFGFR